MFNYEELYRPYTVGGTTLEKSVMWAKKITNAPDLVVEQALADIMYQVSAGKDFRGPCECGCGMSNPHTGIEHALRDRINVILHEAQQAFVGVLNEKENLRIENKMRAIALKDKAYIKMMRPPLRERSPVLKWIYELVSRRK